MQYCTPEAAGISSRHVLAFYRDLERCNLSTHSVLMGRGDRIFTESYYAPFHKDFKHRMYSVSKSFVSIAVGFCAQDGLLSLDDPMADYFTDYFEANPNAHRPTSTIRDMLRMQTTQEHGIDWFKTGTKDRTAVYFDCPNQKNPGTLFSYDSSGSYMLGVIVERVTKKPFLAYLQEKVLNDIGFSRDAYCIKAPGGHSFGDSGVMCTAKDLWLFSRFVLNMGAWGGKQYLNADYVRAATTMQVCTNDFGFATNDCFGYGYKFWGQPQGCFAMHGMGNQIGFCDPAHDFVFAINSDNQGTTHGYDLIAEALYRNIIDNLGDGTPLPEDPAAKAELDAYMEGRPLFSLREAKTSPMADRISGKTFICDKNPMGIKWFRLELEGTAGRFYYENEQGEKCFPFGFGYNELAKFPQEGYADMTATFPAPGNYYDAAFSADWPYENTLRVRVQIIDKYFGNLGILFAFRDPDTVSVRMTRKAENFLREYDGMMNAKAAQ